MSVNKFGTSLPNNNNSNNNNNESAMTMTRLLTAVDDRFTRKIEAGIANARLDAEYQRSQLETRVQRAMSDIVNAQLSRLEDDLNTTIERRFDHLKDRFEEFTTAAAAAAATSQNAISTTNLYERKEQRNASEGRRRRR